MQYFRNKQKIRTFFLLGKFGSDFSVLVHLTGIEPAHLSILDPKSNASASSATGATADL